MSELPIKRKRPSRQRTNSHPSRAFDSGPDPIAHQATSAITCAICRHPSDSHLTICRADVRRIQKLADAEIGSASHLAMALVRARSEQRRGQILRTHMETY